MMKRDQAFASSRGETPPTVSWPPTRLPLHWILLATAFAYLPVLFSDYVIYDDPGWLLPTQAPFPAPLHPTVWHSLLRSVAGNWCPLTNAVFLVETSLFGLHPMLSHAIELALHLLNVALVYRLVADGLDMRRAALPVAALFALHPANVEAVAWVADRKGLLSSLFLFLSLLTYLSWARRRSWRAYWGSVGLFALCLAAKASFVLLPLMLLVLDWWPRNRRSRPRQAGALFLEKLPFVCLSALMSVLVYHAESGAHGILARSLVMNCETAVVACARYIANAFAPVDLNVIVLHPGVWPASLLAGAGCLLGGALAAACVGLRRERAFLACLALFLLSIAPLLQFIPIGDQYISDRYGYVPYIWLFIAAWRCGEALGLAPVWRQRAWACVTVAVAVDAGIQVHTWRDTETLMRRAIRVDAGNAAARRSLAVYYSSVGRFPDAVRQIKKADKLAPGEVWVRKTAAGVFTSAGRFEEASLYYGSAFDGRHPADLLMGYATCLARAGDERLAGHALLLSQEAATVDPSPVALDCVASVAASYSRRRPPGSVTTPPVPGRAFGPPAATSAPRPGGRGP
jgi:protein O-mannosyl-transferase